LPKSKNMLANMLKEYLEIAPKIQKALKKGRPVVALESTIISHGMPFPKNVATALLVENMVRSQGAIPATIAILDGKMKVGLTKKEITRLGKEGRQVTKTSRRDLPFVLAKKISGATTVASTMIIANLAGIKIFATGGIGGVHRGAENSMDISADLQELAKTNVAVISAGVKSILDLPLTLEYLETHGVPVIGYQTDEFPAFFSRKSGLPVDYKMDTPKALAKALHIKWSVGLDGGANPIPKDAEIKFSFINKAIEKALKLADKEKVKGKAITPYLLAKIEELTKGKSLAANIQLVLNNAKLAAQIAVELSKK
jgi:pseudouridine-5'-phosphate glycosidase